MILSISPPSFRCRKPTGVYVDEKKAEKKTAEAPAVTEKKKSDKKKIEKQTAAASVPLPENNHLSDFSRPHCRSWEFADWSKGFLRCCHYDESESKKEGFGDIPDDRIWICRRMHGEELHEGGNFNVEKSKILDMRRVH
jgi:hypothetical protein